MLDFDIAHEVVDYRGQEIDITWTINKATGREYLDFVYRKCHPETTRYDRDRDDCEMETWVRRNCEWIDRKLDGADSL